MIWILRPCIPLLADQNLQFLLPKWMGNAHWVLGRAGTEVAEAAEYRGRSWELAGSAQHCRSQRPLTAAQFCAVLASFVLHSPSEKKSISELNPPSGYLIASRSLLALVQK